MISSVGCNQRYDFRKVMASTAGDDYIPPTTTTSSTTTTSTSSTTTSTFVLPTTTTSTSTTTTLLPTTTTSTSTSTTTTNIATTTTSTSTTTTTTTLQPPSTCQPGQTGRMNFILWPQDRNDLFWLRMRFENGKYLGDHYYGQPIINFTPTNLNTNGISFAKYNGWTGGDGPTRLDCSNTSCSGTISGHSARLNMSIYNGVETLTGVMNFYRFTLTKSATRFEITTNGAGNLYMEKEPNGDFEGNAYYFTNNGIRTFRARLEGEGCLSNFTDDPMLVIILASPLTVADDVEAGLE